MRRNKQSMAIRKHQPVKRLLAVSVVAGLALLFVPATGWAATPSGSNTGLAESGPPAPAIAKPTQPPATGTMAPPAAEQAQTTAARQAKASGRPVSVAALTTEYSTVTANPSGTMTLSESVEPQRVRRGGHWVAASANLVKNPDGSYSPAASVAGLDIAAGGSRSLARMTDQQASLSLAWPSVLPAPSIAGPTATYSNVLPGVDLSVTATIYGGFSEVLVVHSAKAATNPALHALRLSATVHGVSLHADTAGNLTAATAHGQTVFSSPASTMWDSTRPTTPSGSTSAASTIAGPGRGAHLARVTATAADNQLTLRPDTGLLTGKSTHYPVFIDPTWVPHDAAGNEQDRDEVLSAYPTTNTLNSDNPDQSYGLGVGYQGYESPTGIERAYYQIGIPSVIYGAEIISASLNTEVTYAAAKGANSDTVHAYQVCTISTATTFRTPPCQDGQIGSASFTTTENFPNISVGFGITGVIQSAANGHWANLTVGLFNSTESNDMDFVRFGKSPSFEIKYDHAPNTPGNLNAASNGDSTGCATSAPYPWMGNTASTTPPTLTAKLTDPDGDAMSATFAYSANGGAVSTLTSANTSSGGTASVTLPASFIAGLSTTQPSSIDWHVNATDGQMTSGWSSMCIFNYDPGDLATPTINSSYFPYINTGGTEPPAGTSGSFAISASGESVVRFVYSLDYTPPVTTNSGGSTTCASESSYGNYVTATNNTATITLATQAPGTHMLYVYSCDVAGNASSLASWEFATLNNPASTYTSLAAAYGNTAISSNSDTTQADADGPGNSISASDLSAAGWKPGATITLDGAQLTLPDYGSGAPDNVMAANQTIDMSEPSTGNANALVFLVMATDSTTQAPALDYTEDYGTELAAPAVPAGTPIAGNNCTLTNNLATDCHPASGTITYSNGNSQTYYLGVPDWVTGPTGPAAITLPHENTPSKTSNQPVSLYAFSVPLNPGETISSVTLPDISNTVNDLNATDTPGLHVFAMGLRNTITAASGASWTGAWSSPVEGQFSSFQGDSDFSNETFRIAATPSISGTNVRLHLSDALGTSPLTIGHVTIATQSANSPAPTGTPQNITFAGSAGVTIPAGTDAYSDPLPFTVTAGTPLMVSIYLSNTVTYLVQHSFASDSYEWVSANGAGDHTADTATSAFTSSGTANGYFTDILTGLDVTNTTSQGTVAVLGDNLVDPFATATTPVLAAHRVNDDLASALTAAGTPAYGVIAEGIENNQITSDQSGQGGPSAFSRLDRDILDQPGISTVVIDEGLTDLIDGGTSGPTLTDAVGELTTQLNAFGISVITTTLTPCDGYTNPAGVTCTGTSTTQSTIDQNRVLYNDGYNGDGTGTLTSAPPNQYVTDFDGAIAVPDPNTTEEELNNAAAPNDFDTGDHVNLTNDGYTALTQTIPLTDLTRYTPPTTY